MKVLVVVSSASERRKLEKFFAGRKLEVEAVASAEAAREACSSDAISFLLVDLDLTDDPLQLCGLSKSGGLDPWIVALTPKARPEALREAFEAGADDYLKKPIDLGELQLKMAIGQRALAARARRTSAEADARRADRRFRTLVETMHEGLFQVDGEGLVTSANSRLSEITGFSLDELVGEAAETLLIDPDLLERLPGGSLFGGQTTEQFSLPLRTKAGDERWVELVATPAPVHDDDAGSLVVVQDVSGQRAAEDELRHREAYFRALLESASDLVTIIDRDGHILYQSPSSERLLHRKASLAIGQRLPELIHPQDRAAFREALESVLEEGHGATATVESRHRRGEKSWLVLESLIKNLVDDPVIGGVLITSRDATEQRKFAEQLQRQQAFFRQLFQRSPTAIIILDTEGAVVEANDSFVDLFGYEVDQVAGSRLDELIVPEALQSEADELTGVVAAGQPVERETTRRRADGTEVEVAIIGFPIEIDGRRIATYAIYTDITDRKRAERKLFHDAFHDALTGLPNRTLLTERLERDLRRARRRDDYQFALVFLDLDGFKQINDSLGHGAGDEFLIEVARRLENCLRPGDTVARIGGDEFLLILEDIKTSGDATRVADRVLDALHEPFVVADGEEVRSSGSLGIAFSSSGYDDAEALIGDADLAMYRAKRRGKACYEIFDPAMQQDAQERAQLESDLSGALERGELDLFTQPIVDTRNRRPIAFESLTRWRHPDRGTLEAAEWLPLLREADAQIALDHWALDRAAEILRRWDATHPEIDWLRLSVNLHLATALDPRTATLLGEIAERRSIHLGTLALELPEDELAAAGDAVVDPLWRLAQTGVEIWVDRYGAGALPLPLLQRLPVACLKIDPALVRELAPGDPGIEVVRAAAAIADSFALRLVAVGVETSEQERILSTLGLSAQQGWRTHRVETSTESLEAALTATQTDARDETLVLPIAGTRVQVSDPRDATDDPTTEAVGTAGSTGDEDGLGSRRTQPTTD